MIVFVIYQERRDPLRGLEDQVIYFIILYYYLLYIFFFYHMIAFPISQERRDPLRGREDQVHDGGRGRGHDPLHDGRGGQS